MSLARLGQGPFSIVDFWEPDVTIQGGSGIKLDPACDLDHCACCGKEITWRVVIENKADGLCCVLGRTCAAVAADHIGTTTDQLKLGFRRIEKDRKARLAQEKLVAQRLEEAKLKLVRAREAMQEAIEGERDEGRSEFSIALFTAAMARRFEDLHNEPLYLELGFVTNHKTRKYHEHLVMTMD